jgi:hypothetical protein
MTDTKLTDELFAETRIGQILILGGVIRGKDGQSASDLVDECEREQKTNPAFKGKLIGEIFEAKGLCSKEDVEAGLAVQKEVRERLTAEIERCKQPKAEEIDKMVEDAYTHYESQHPGYHRQQKEVRTEAEHRLTTFERYYDYADAALKTSVSGEPGDGSQKCVEPHSVRWG